MEDGSDEMMNVEKESIVCTMVVGGIEASSQLRAQFIEKVTIGLSLDQGLDCPLHKKQNLTD